MSQFKEFKASVKVDENSVWYYFLRDKENQLVKCKKCDKQLKSSGGSTSGLHTHLRTIHSITLLKRKLLDDPVPTTSTSGVWPQTKNPKSMITDYLHHQHDRTFPAVLSRLVALDGLPFNVFITSRELRTSLESRGFVVPKSAETIRNIVVKYADSIREMVKTKLTSLQSQGIRFSLTFDEWSSLRNRRYLNVNIHIEKEFWNLGLARVLGSLPAEKCVQLVQQVLEQFGLVYNEDIVSITTDGASVMRKVGRISNWDQQLCFAHGIQLAVLDVLYVKPKAPDVNMKITDESNDSDEESVADSDDKETNDEENDDSSFQVALIEQNAKVELTESLQPLIAKVRKVVKLFRKSPTKNDQTLQKYTEQEYGKNLPLVLDTKTRWNSLYLMLERFLKLKNCIRKSLIDLDTKIEISDSEFDTISSVVACLAPVKVAVETLCRSDANLKSADTTIIFMINNLGSSNLAVKLKTALVRRINERRNPLSSLQHYLQKGHQQYDNKDEALEFQHLSKTAIANAVVRLNERLNRTTNQGSTSSNVWSDSDSVDSTSNLTLQEKLNMAITNDLKCRSKSNSNVSKDLSKIIRKEMVVFEEDRTLGTLLRNAYEYLKTVQPTSVESERAFSASGNIVSKLRSSLGDDTLNALCFLRAYFQKERKILSE